MGETQKEFAAVGSFLCYRAEFPALFFGELEKFGDVGDVDLAAHSAGSPLRRLRLDGSEQFQVGGRLLEQFVDDKRVGSLVHPDEVRGRGHLHDGGALGG